MALTTLFVTVFLVAIADANFPNFAQNQFNPLAGFQIPTIPPIALPNFPFQNFRFPQIRIPTIPPIVLPKIPTAEEIANMVPSENGVVNGVVVSSHSSMGIGPDGKPQRNGGSSILINDNGKITRQQTGNDPPVILDPQTSNSFKASSQEDLLKLPNIKPIEPFKFKPFEPFKFKPFKPITFKPFEPLKFKPFNFEPFNFEPIHFEPIINPIDPDVLNNYVPGENANFHSVSFSSSSFSNDVNGVKTEGGRETSVVNNNGDVKGDDRGYFKGEPTTAP